MEEDGIFAGKNMEFSNSKFASAKTRTEQFEMLPSKGFFNTISCPFDDSGYCGRCHCHYKHNKKQKKILIKEEARNEKIISSLKPIQEPIIKISVEQNQLPKSKIEEKVEDKINTPQEISKVPIDIPLVVPSYKPTPIAELQKRHIPVFYAPSRAASVVVKKKTLSEGKKTKAEYVPESVNGNPFPFSYNPTPSITPEYIPAKPAQPKINLDIQPSYVPSKIGEETFAPTTVYVPEGGSNTCGDYIPGSNKTTEVPCYVPQTTISSPLYKINYSLPDMGLDQSSTLIQNNFSNKTLSSGLDNLDFAEINDEINLLQEILEEDGQYENHEDCVKDETVQSDEICSVSDENKKNSSRDMKYTLADDSINSKSNEGNQTKNSIIDLDNIKCDKLLKNNTGKESKILVNENNSNRIDNFKTNQHEAVTNSNDRNEKHKMNLLSDTLKKEEQNKNKRKRGSKDEPEISKRHKSDYKSGRSKNSSRHKSSTGKHSHSDKHSHKGNDLSRLRDNSHKGNDLSRLRDKSEKTKHKKSSKSRHSKHHCSKNKSKKSTSKKSSSHSENYEKISHNHRKEIRRTFSESSPGELSSEEEDYSDGDVEIVHDTFPSIVITDSDSEEEDDSQPNNTSSAVEEEITPTEYSGKKRIAHGSGQPTKKFKQNPKSHNPYSDLLNRWTRVSALIREGDSSTSNTVGACQQKIRIAHVPNVINLLKEKKELLNKKLSPATIKKPSTSSANNEPNMVRTNSHINRPLPTISRTRVPLHIRQSSVNRLLDAYLELYSTKEAEEMALTTEKDIVERAATPGIYQNIVTNTIVRLRKEAEKRLSANNAAATVDASNNRSYTYANNAAATVDASNNRSYTYANNAAATVDASNNRSYTYANAAAAPVDSNYYPSYTHGKSLYECISEYILTEDQLASNGFPLKHPSKEDCAYVDLKGRRENKFPKPINKNAYRCCNCHLEFEVDEEGFSIGDAECKFHYGKPKGKGDSRTYNCCKSKSKWCTSAQYHVRETANDDCLTGFVTTYDPPEGIKRNNYGIYALDCEMCYTTIGQELVRITIVDITSKSVYDTFVLPENPIIDFCTRYSGVTEDSFKGCKKRLKDVQKDLLKIVNSKTILIGHGLENDFKALKVIHKTVVDTSVLYPHREPSLKNSLRYLAEKVLFKAIQNNGDKGHDSFEDAVTSLELVIKKVKTDSACRKPRAIINYIRPGR